VQLCQRPRKDSSCGLDESILCVFSPAAIYLLPSVSLPRQGHWQVMDTLDKAQRHCELKSDPWDSLSCLSIHCFKDWRNTTSSPGWLRQMYQSLDLDQVAHKYWEDCLAICLAMESHKHSFRVDWDTSCSLVLNTWWENGSWCLRSFKRSKLWF